MRLSDNNPMTKVLMVFLVFEVIVFGLSSLTMVWIDDLPLSTSLAAGGGAALLALVATARLRKPGGYLLGWAAQVAGVALGFLTYPMFFMGGLFALLWVLTFVLGKKIDSAAQ